MARDFSLRTDIDNTLPAAFPDGRLLDSNPASANNGTAVNEAVYGDVIQFFLKLMRDTSITPNGNPDNETNSQYISALDAYIRDVATGSPTQRGSVELANQAEVDAGTDPLRVLSVATFTNRLNSTTRFLRNENTASPLRASTFEIGEWNMDTTGSVLVTHNISVANIRVVQAVIIDDTSSLSIPVPFLPLPAGTPPPAQADLPIDLYLSSTNSTQIQLVRRTGGAFDNNTDYDSASPFNRGWVTIHHTTPI